MHTSASAHAKQQHQMKGKKKEKKKPFNTAYNFPSITSVFFFFFISDIIMPQALWKGNGVDPLLETQGQGNTPKTKDYLWWSLCTLYLHACQVRVIVGSSGLCRTYVFWVLINSFACWFSKAEQRRSVTALPQVGEINCWWTQHRIIGSLWVHTTVLKTYGHKRVDPYWFHRWTNLDDTNGF